MSEEDITQVDKEWKFGGAEASRRFVQCCAETMRSVTVRDSAGKLVAYEMMANHGALSKLFLHSLQFAFGADAVSHPTRTLMCDCPPSV